MRFTLTPVVILLGVLNTCSANIFKRQGIPVCATTCFADIDSPDCPGGATDCRCSTADFVANVKACFQTSCSSNDINDALDYLSSMCPTTQSTTASPGFDSSIPSPPSLTTSGAAPISSSTLTASISPTLPVDSSSTSPSSVPTDSSSISGPGGAIAVPPSTSLPMTSVPDSVSASTSTLISSLPGSTPTATNGSGRDGVHPSDPLGSNGLSSVPDDSMNTSPISTNLHASGESGASNFTTPAYTSPEPVYPSALLRGAASHSVNDLLTCLIVTCAVMLLCL